MTVSRRSRSSSGTVTGTSPADASWCKVDVADVLDALKPNHLTVISLLGDYAGTPYTTGSARFICIAAAS
jgi:hypothetical protein